MDASSIKQCALIATSRTRCHCGGVVGALTQLNARQQSAAVNQDSWAWCGVENNSHYMHMADVFILNSCSAPKIGP